MKNKKPTEDNDDQNKQIGENEDKPTKRNGNKGTTENKSKSKRKNFTFNRLDGIIWAFIIFFACPAIYVIYVSNFLKDPKFHERLNFIDDYWIVIAGTLSLILFTLNSIERVWQKCYWGRKPHQNSRVGCFALAALLFASVTLKEAAEEVADQETLAENINSSTDTTVNKGVEKANDFTKKYSDSLGISFSKLLIVSSKELSKVINHRDLEQQTQVANLGLNVTRAFNQLGTNLQGQAEHITNLGQEVKKAFTNLDSNLKVERRVAEARQETLLKNINQQVTKTGTEILKLYKEQSARDSAATMKQLDLIKKLVNHIGSLSQNQRMDNSSEKSKEQDEIPHSVFVYIGKEKALIQQGYLITSRWIRKSYKIKNFPNKDIRKVGIGEPFIVQDTIAALCDYQGKLREGKEYTLSNGKSGQTIFFRNSLLGQRILVVLKD